MRLFKRETRAYWVDIYFYGTTAADEFAVNDLPSTVRSIRIGPTQVQVLSLNPKELEDAALGHEKAMLEKLRADRLEQLAAMGEAAAVARSTGGEFEEPQALDSGISRPRAAAKKTGGCRGCGKK